MSKLLRPIMFYAAVATFYALSINLAFDLGTDQGVLQGKTQCQQQELTRLNNTINAATALIAKANDASLTLGAVINSRIAADAKATQEIRRALSTTAHLRVDCVLPDDVLRQLSAARERANQAAASGLDDAVSAHTRPPGWRY